MTALTTQFLYDDVMRGYEILIELYISNSVNIQSDNKSSKFEYKEEF